LALFGRYDGVLWGLVVILAAIVASRLLKWVVGRLEARHPEEESELVGLRRNETAVALLATAIPYVAGIVVIITIASILLLSTAAAPGGSALVLVLVGFGAQRFLMDVIAGTLIAFERWYGVGDFVRIEPAQVNGIVEQFGFRTTLIRSLNAVPLRAPSARPLALGVFGRQQVRGDHRSAHRDDKREDPSSEQQVHAQHRPSCVRVRQ
jgi:small-conductance mechanosensitive channel